MNNPKEAIADHLDKLVKAIQPKIYYYIEDFNIKGDVIEVFYYPQEENKCEDNLLDCEIDLDKFKAYAKSEHWFDEGEGFYSGTAIPYTIPAVNLNKIDNDDFQELITPEMVKEYLQNEQWA